MIWPIIYTHLRHWANELDDRGIVKKPNMSAGNLGANLW